ncbi:MAG: Hsp20/alpha crystallin family protein [Halodesulfurarchaeum sp.]
MSRFRPPVVKYGTAIGEEMMEQVGRATARVQEETPLSADVLESDAEFIVVFDAPGTTSNDVQVSYDDGSIEVRIDRFRSFYERFEMRIPGRGLSLRGRAELPADARVDRNAASAELRHDGTLWIHLPKVDLAEPSDETVESSDETVESSDETAEE